MLEIKRNGLIPGKGLLQKTLDSFSPKQMLVFAILFLVLIVSAISVIGKINKRFLVYLPEKGGTLTEGVLGTPRFINPVIATTDTDKDLSSLIYAGLMKKKTDGSIVPDLAESYEISPDGLTYTFKIKSNATFQDKTSITGEDVMFTIEKIKDSSIKSPLQAIWDGVGVSVDENDPLTVIFRLGESYASFLDNVTIGIIPKHIWEKYSSEEFNFVDSNLNAVGGGAYKIDNIRQKKNGLIEEFELSVFKNYAGEKPFIKNINFKFYKNEDDLVKAYRHGQVDQISSISPKTASTLESEGYKPTTATLSRIFGLFFNANHNDIFRNKNIVKAIELGIEKDKIVSDVLLGFGSVINSPVPDSLYNQPNPLVTQKSLEERMAEANALLDKEGYKLNADTGFRQKDGKNLGFSISTADVTELRQTATIIKDDLAKLGIDVSVKVFEVGMLNQNVIRPREYEALLFGQVIRNESDLFAFWHSSQRNDPGLNISIYTNSKVDKTLEDLIAAHDETVRATKIQELIGQINDDRPAIFLYSPDFIYMEGDKVQNVKLDRITSSSERFLGISDWYIRTDAVWKFLAKNN